MLRGNVTAQKGVGFASRKATQQGQEWCLSSSCTRQAMYTPPLPPLPLTPTPFPKLPLSPPQLPPPLVPRPRIEPGRRHQCAASLLHCCRRPLACARVVCVLRACKCLCVRVCLCAMVCVAPRRVGSRRAASRRVGSGRAVPNRVGLDHNESTTRLAVRATSRGADIAGDIAGPEHTYLSENREGGRFQSGHRVLEHKG